MRRTIQICHGAQDRVVGVLRQEKQNARERVAFSYDPAWLAAEDAFALAPSVPLRQGFHYHQRTEGGSLFPGSLADMEPDGWGRRVILRAHATRRAADRGQVSHGRRASEGGNDVLSDLDILLMVDDVSRLGALRLRDETGVFQAHHDGTGWRTPPLVELRALLLASHAIESNRETPSDLAYLTGKGTSLGGMRPKCSILDGQGHLAIGKFPSIADERAVTKAEVLALRLAQRAGINAASAELVLSDGMPVAVIRRFDRRDDGSRIPYMSAATMLGVEDGGRSDHTYTQMVEAMRVHGHALAADLEELWRRIAFSILITNVDDHLRNHGFLHHGSGGWSLAPAFDVNPFPDKARDLKTWISEDAGPAASIDALRAAAPFFGIARPQAKEILRQVETAVSQWRTVGGALGMSAKELDQFHDAFEHPERANARRG